MIDSKSALRDKLVSGARALSAVVGKTYGPKGKTVIVERPMGAILATKDGVSVAREVDLEDPYANAAVQVIKQAALKVNDEAGDGTTTTVILSSALLEEGHKLIAAGNDPMQLGIQITETANRISDWLLKNAKKVTTQVELEQLALVSSNGDEEIARLLAEAVMSVGDDGTILIEDSKGVDTTLSFREGYDLDRGPCHEQFMAGQTTRVVDNPLVCVVGKTLSTIDDIAPILEASSQWPGSPVVIFAHSIEGLALKTMLMNDKEGVVKSIGVFAPGIGDNREKYLQDVAAATLSTYIDPTFMKLKDWDDTWLGVAKQIVFSGRKTTIVSVEDATEALYARAEEVKREPVVSEYDTDRIKERVARLTGGLAVLAVGGYSEAALKERRARIEDSLGALRSALSTGILPGGLTSLIKYPYGSTLSDRIWSKAVGLAYNLLLSNGGVEGAPLREVVVDLPLWEGYDLKQSCIRDLSVNPLVAEPLRVLQQSVLRSASVASLLLSVEVGIAKSPNPSPHKGK